MLPAFLRERLSNKVILATLTLLVLILAGTNILAVREEERADFEELEARTAQAAMQGALFLAPLIEDGRYRELDAHVQSLVDGGRDLAFLRLHSTDGVLLAQYPPEGSGDARLFVNTITRVADIPRTKPLDPEEQDANAADHPETEVSAPDRAEDDKDWTTDPPEAEVEEEAEEAAEPRAARKMHPTMLGKITAASSLLTLENSAQARHRAAGLEIAFVLIGTCILLVLFLKRRLDDPLSRIAAEAMELGRGKLTRPIRWSGDDEIGTLADALERMRKNLLDHYKKREETHERAMEDARMKELYVTEVCAELLEPTTHLLTEVAAPSGSGASVEAAAMRIQTRLNQVLAHARQSSGAETSLRTSEIDLHQQAQVWLERLRYEAELHGLELRNEIPPGMRFTGDPELIDQIVANLLDNSARTTKQGHIALSAQNIDNEVLLIQIADSGGGIPLELQQSLFERDQRGFSAHMRKYQGTWIGLLVARRSIEAMGGLLQLDNTPGFGSSFSVVIPLKRGMNAEALKDRLRQQTIEEITFDDDMTI